MIVNKDTTRLVEKHDFIYITILLAIALGIGVYLIATTVLIAQDGVYYIERAQKLSSDPVGIIKAHPPGYPFLIFAAHKFVTLFTDNPSVFTWIYSAQSVSLLCRVLSLIPLYFIGKLLVGSRRSFWGLLILIVLPYPAEFGSDVVREWPHILFLSTGLLFLIWGSRFGKWWMFAIAGLAAGLGHTIREECAQIVIYGTLWLLISLFLPRGDISRLKAIRLTLILLIGFAIPAAPYMKVRGRILPPKLKSVISCNTPWQ
ncbi:MAG: glycosyltransferase family 39 protein, partial [Planctomycetes bacterium]|nr:glycosyltransferase family 39 protein [Planctomycetota bacterium]